VYKKYYWIDFFNGTDTGQVTKLVTYIQDDEPLTVEITKTGMSTKYYVK
jgi:hypothetical protein